MASSAFKRRDISLNYDAAYRAVDRGNRAYADVLVDVSGYQAIPTTALKPRKSDSSPYISRDILLSLMPPKADLALPDGNINHLVRHIRSYNRSFAYFAGHNGERIDHLTRTTEGEVIDYGNREEDLQLLFDIIGSAKLMLGVPSGQLWLAAWMGIPTICLYPDKMPPKRWFGSMHVSNVIQLKYTPSDCPPYVLLAGLRQLIEKF
jgi:ADP-heptose:LPS heptosyltransferase